jgi:TP901 family phage tail tape measure protein
MPGGKIDILVEPDTRAFPSQLASGLRSASGIASSIGRGLGLAVAAGTAVASVGLASVIKLGNEYTGALNEMQAVSGATALQMAKVGQTAKDLGADMTLPATSAADAAQAMVELAKGGLSVDEAMAAAKGTLQLAAAAQVDGATAAELQAAALNSFGLAADQAGRVADVLANTANASASSMIDVGNSLKYVAPVSAALKISIEDTAAAIGLLANQGIKGEQAGTSLRGILASLASPSKQAKQAMDALGLSVFDAQGKFVGLRAFTDQLAQAKLRLSDADFAAAASTAFGNEGFTAANALAAEGATSFDQMATSVSRAGGAADVAAAQTKGLGGAWEGFKSQLETAGIEVYEVIAPGLERAVRAGSDFVSRFTPTVVSGIQNAVAAGELFGPELAQAIVARGDAVLDAVKELVEPIADGLLDALNDAANIGTTVFSGFAKVVREGADAVKPLAEGVGDLLENLDKAGGPVGTLVTGLELVYGVASGIVSAVKPLLELVGGLASAFSDLPGPVQSAAIAILALRAGPTILGGLKNALSSVKSEASEAGNQTGFLGRSLNLMTAPVRIAASGVGGVVGTLRQFNDEARVQRSLADQAGESVGRLGSYAAAFNTSAIPAVSAARSFAEQTSAIREGAAAAGQPISAMGAAIGTLVERSDTLSAMRDAFHSASEGATRFGTAAGVAAAAGTGLKAAAGGLVSALGGPVGIAIGVVTVGLGLLASKQEEAAQKAADHRRDVSKLADALRDSNGAITDSIRKQQAQDLIADGVADKFKAQGVSLDALTAATLKQGSAYDDLHKKLIAIAQANSDEVANADSGNISRQYNERGLAALDLIKVLEEYGGKTDEAQQQQEELDEAIANGTASMLDATDSGRSIAGAMQVLADRTSSADDKARALKDALDALTGGTISLEQAQSRVNEVLAGLRDRFGENLDKTKGWGKELLNADGSISTVTENGRDLLDTVDDLTTAMADVAQKTFDAARAQGDDYPTAMAKAQAAAQGVRDGFVAQSDVLGLMPDQVQALADRYGLLPEQVATLITTPGMDSTKVEMLLLRQLVDQVPPDKPITVRSLSDEAKQKLIDLGFTVKTLPDGSVQVVANTQAAKDALDEATRPRTVTITAVYKQTSKTPYGTMNPLGSYSARGNIIAAAYADGGVHPKLTPMKAGLATVVPPNSWRIVGDRIRDDEFYIPDNDDSRSVALGLEWVRRRGFVLARTFASGGVATVDSRVPGSSQPASVTVNVPVQVQDNRSAFEVARVTSAEVAWAQRFLK